MRAFGNHLIVKEINDKVSLAESGLKVNIKTQKDVRYRKGEVFNAPPYFHIGQTKVDNTIKEGDVVLYDVASGYTQRDSDGTEYKIVRFDGVVAVL